MRLKASNYGKLVVTKLYFLALIYMCTPPPPSTCSLKVSTMKDMFFPILKRKHNVVMIYFIPLTYTIVVCLLWSTLTRAWCVLFLK